MIEFAFIDADGIPTGGGSKPVLPEGAVPLFAPFTTLDLPRLIFGDGAWQERPRLPPPELTGSTLSVSGLPEGAVLSATRLGSAEAWEAPATEGAASLALPQDGTFAVIVSAALPWLAVERVFIRGSGSPELAAAALLRARDAARARINATIGEARLKYVTDIPGQQTIYTEKQAEARAYLTAQPTPLALTDYPLLAAEVGVTAPTAWQLAQVWANKAVLFKYVAAITEKLRMQATFAVDAAMTEAEIEAAVAASLTALSERLL